MRAYILCSTFLVFAIFIANMTTLNRSKRLLNAEISDVEIPHHASLQICKRKGVTKTTPIECRKYSRHLCSGFILDERSVVTVGLCYHYMKEIGGIFDFYAVVGMKTLYTEEGSYHKVVSTRTTPQNMQEFVEFGVAVFTIEPQFTWSNSVQPAPLAHINPYKTNKYCTVSGFGCGKRMRYPEIMCDLTHRLHIRKVPMSTIIHCESVLRLRGLIGRAEHFSCFHMQTICNGDLGNPLTCNGGLSALATTRYNTCRTNQVDIYINIGQYRSFFNKSSNVHPSLITTVVLPILLLLVFPAHPFVAKHAWMWY